MSRPATRPGDSTHDGDDRNIILWGTISDVKLRGGDSLGRFSENSRESTTPGTRAGLPLPFGLSAPGYSFAIDGHLPFSIAYPTAAPLPDHAPARYLMCLPAKIVGKRLERGQEQT